MPDNQNQSAPIAKVVIAFAIVYIVWGSTYFSVQAALRDFPPFILGALRFMAAGIILLAWLGFKKEKLFYRPQLKKSFIVGNLLLFIGNGTITWAEETLPSSLVAVLVSASPVWFVLLDSRTLKSNLRNPFVITGVTIGLAGVILLFSEKIYHQLSPAKDNLEMISLIVVILGSISWCIGSLYSKYKTSGNPIVGAGWQMVFAAFSFIIVAIFTGEFNHLNIGAIHLRAWLSVIYLVLFGSIAGYSAYIWLLQVRPATQVSTNAYVNPVVAVLLGVLFGGEFINSLQIAGLAIILLSVFIINYDKYKIR
ncbi:MAG TPA: EamA family transporter [Hanamia sp.]